MDAQEELDSLRFGAEKFLKENHITVLIKQEGDKMAELIEMCNEELPELVDLDLNSLQGKLILSD